MNTVDPDQLVPALPYQTKDPCDWCDRPARWIGLNGNDEVARACAIHKVNLRR